MSAMAAARGVAHITRPEDGSHARSRPFPWRGHARAATAFMSTSIPRPWTRCSGARAVLRGVDAAGADAELTPPQ